MPCRTRRSPDCGSVDVEVGSRQHHRPITPDGLLHLPAPDRTHHLRPPPLSLPHVPSRTIARVAPQLPGRDPPLSQGVEQRHGHLEVVPAGSRYLHVGDHLRGVLLLARLRHLHLVSIPLVTAVAHLRIVGRLHRVRPHFPWLLERYGRLPLSGIVVIRSGASVLMTTHVALLPHKPLQQPVLLHPGHHRAPEPIHQPVHVSRTHRQPAASVPRAGILVARPLAIPPDVPSHQSDGDPFTQLRMFPSHGFQEHPKRLAEQPQPAQQRDVADDVRRVQPLPAGPQPQSLDDSVRRLHERQPTPVVPHQPHPEVVQRLLGKVRLIHLQPQGVMPQQIELQLLQSLHVGQVEHLLEDVHPKHRLHRTVRSAHVGAVHRCEALLVYQRQRLVPEHLRPTPLHQLRLLRRHQELRLPQALLGPSCSEHASLSTEPSLLHPDSNHITTRQGASNRTFYE